jgi:hypothetical protein
LKTKKNIPEVREGNRGGRDYIMHEGKKYRAEDERPGYE